MLRLFMEVHMNELLMKKRYEEGYYNIDEAPTKCSCVLEETSLNNEDKYKTDRNRKLKYPGGEC